MLTAASASLLYDQHRSDVLAFTKLNFDNQVSKNRDKGISIVHYYDSTDASRDLKASYEQFATENLGVFRIGSVDCDDNPQICSSEGVTDKPTIKIYPTFPIPTQNLDLSDGFDVTKLKKAAGRFYTDKSIEITGKNHETFIKEDPGIILYTIDNTPAIAAGHPQDRTNAAMY